ncbi:MAG: leucine-rich repeat domain-containing protein, partial [Clostridia bacterium]|nr:leucine-rich repeat domain-containing protein [Clostridia bacterium]
MKESLKKKGIKVISVFLAICLICGLVLLFDTLFIGEGGLFYRLEDGGYELYGIKNKSSVTIVIPEKHLGLPIVSIAPSTFKDCQNLMSVTIPDTLNYIGNYAFANCSNLTNIDLPKGLTSIELGSFSNCTSLVSVRIPDNVTKIDGYAFSGCSNL